MTVRLKGLRPNSSRVVLTYTDTARELGQPDTAPLFHMVSQQTMCMGRLGKPYQARVVSLSEIKLLRRATIRNSWLYKYGKVMKDILNTRC